MTIDNKYTGPICVGDRFEWNPYGMEGWPHGYCRIEVTQIRDNAVGDRLIEAKTLSGPASQVWNDEEDFREHVKPYREADVSNAVCPKCGSPPIAKLHEMYPIAYKCGTYLFGDEITEGMICLLRQEQAGGQNYAAEVITGAAARKQFDALLAKARSYEQGQIDAVNYLRSTGELGSD